MQDAIVLHQYFFQTNGSAFSLVVFFLVPRDHGSNLAGGEKNLLFHFWVVITWLELIRDYANRSIHDLIHHFLLSIRLNNLMAWYKKLQAGHSAIVNYLLQPRFSCNPHSTTIYQDTPLHLACYAGKLDVSKSFVVFVMMQVNQLWNITLNAMAVFQPY